MKIPNAAPREKEPVQKIYGVCSFMYYIHNLNRYFTNIFKSTLQGMPERVAQASDFNIPKAKLNICSRYFFPTCIIVPHLKALRLKKKKERQVVWGLNTSGRAWSVSTVAPKGSFQKRAFSPLRP